MRKYNVNVNGTAYEVTVEEVTGAAAAAPVAAPAPAPAAAPAAAPAGAGEAVTAPMPGNILDVKVTVGQQVTAGQTLFVLEAMKMENEIPAPKAGTVTAISATKGQAVQGGATLCTIA